MAKIDLVAREWADIVFQGRNKDYGAYVLRNGTSKRNVYSILAVLLVAVLGFSAIKLITFIQEQQELARTEAVELSAIQEKKQAKKVEKVEQPKVEPEKVVEKVKSSIKFTAPVIKKDNEVKEEDEIKLDEVEKSDKSVGAFTVEGNDEVGGEVLKAKEEIAPPPEPEKPKEEDTKIFDVVEQMPSFPGGNVMAWLSQNLKYPVIAAENGVQGRVVVQFVVEKDGSVTDVHAVKKVDPSLDKEAERVVKSMPKWIPGKQNGSPVRVKYTLPVTFKLQ
ncbi:MAG: energy transducer TonB [Prevotella sp.]|jgi:protein TonB|nr:energy transducer TonB [Prevotella sp.]